MNKNFEKYLDPEFKGGKIEIPDVDRQELAKLFNELGFKKGVEIGVCEGIYSRILCEEIPGLKLYGVDPYVNYVAFEDESTPIYRARKEHYERLFESTQDYLEEFPNYEFVRKYSMDAVLDFEDESLDFVYIDGDHEYNHVIEDIREWSKKIKKGGIIAGHDYFRLASTKYPLEVKEAVEDYTKENNITPWYVAGRKETLPGEKRDKQRSWFWIIK
jgi:predicted O-methyltransferase YrrM